MENNVGVISTGIKAPIIRKGDNLVDIVVDSVLNSVELKDKDVIGITESVVARAQGNYVTVDDIAEDIIKKFGPAAEIILIKPIYSRNRFSMILKGVARAASKVIFVMPDYDEVGNPSGINPFTGVDIKEYYAEICKSEDCESVFVTNGSVIGVTNRLYCGLHDYKEWKDTYGKTNGIKCYTLADICSNKCEYGLLGSNKASEETLKLFPKKKSALKLVKDVQNSIKEKTGKLVYICVYGDGCFKDPVGGIWEFADPITMPAYTNPEVFESTPNEVKIKYLADNKYANLKGEELNEAIKKEIEEHTNKSLVGNMVSEGTTPRLYRDLLASLMDLTSGSGMRATPFIHITNYF